MRKDRGTEVPRKDGKNTGFALLKGTAVTPGTQKFGRSSAEKKGPEPKRSEGKPLSSIEGGGGGGGGGGQGPKNKLCSAVNRICKNVLWGWVRDKTVRLKKIHRLRQRSVGNTHSQTHGAEKCSCEGKVKRQRLEKNERGDEAEAYCTVAKNTEKRT